MHKKLLHEEYTLCINFQSYILLFARFSLNMSTNASNSNNSKVQLTLIGLFRMHGAGVAAQLSPLVGIEQVVMQGTQPQVTMASVPFHDRSMDALAPRQGRGLLTLFGIRDALDELQHWRAVARNSQAQFAYAQASVDIGVAFNGVLTRAQLQAQQGSLRFLNVKRCAADMQKAWLQQFAQWVREEGGQPEHSMAHVRQMALRPDLFERLLYSDPDLQHIAVMVLPLADRNDVTRVRQVAYLRAGTPLLSLSQGSDQMQVQLPQWMQQPYSAATRN